MRTFIALSLVILMNGPARANAADQSIFAKAKLCLDALHAVYHPTFQLSDFIYYSPEQPKFTVRGQLLGETVLFNSEANEAYPTSTYVGRTGHPTEQSPPDAVWTALKTQFTYALDRLPTTASHNKGHVRAERFHDVIRACRSYYYGNAQRLAEQLNTELENAASKKITVTETFREDSEGRGLKYLVKESQAGDTLPPASPKKVSAQ